MTKANIAQDRLGSVRVATTGPITLAGLQTIDGVLDLAEGDRVLVKDQGDETNGVYTASVGAWKRTLDANTAKKITTGASVYVSEGTANEKLVFTLTNTDPVDLDVDEQVWENIDDAGTTFSPASSHEWLADQTFTDAWIKVKGDTPFGTPVSGIGFYDDSDLLKGWIVLATETTNGYFGGEWLFGDTVKAAQAHITGVLTFDPGSSGIRAALATNATDALIGGGKGTDATDRFSVDHNFKISLGGGALAFDTFLERAGVAHWKATGDFEVTKGLGLWGQAPAAQFIKIADPAGAVTDQDDEARTAIGLIIDALEAVGISALV